MFDTSESKRDSIWDRKARQALKRGDEHAALVAEATAQLIEELRPTRKEKERERIWTLRQRPEIKERKKKWRKEYYQRPDIKERKKKWMKEYCHQQKAKKKERIIDAFDFNTYDLNDPERFKAREKGYGKGWFCQLRRHSFARRYS